MLGIVIVPRDAIVLQEGEQPVPVLLEAFFTRDGCGALIVDIDELPVEALYESAILAEKQPLQPVPVNRIDDGFRQNSKTPYYAFQVFVERVFQKLAVQIPR